MKIRRGTDNIFRDFGFDVDDAAHLQLRSDLMIQLRKRLTALGATQEQTARLLGVSQPRISDLMRGKIDRFSVDPLVKLLGKTGADVRVAVRDHDGQ